MVSLSAFNFRGWILARWISPDIYSYLGNTSSNREVTEALATEVVCGERLGDDCTVSKNDTIYNTSSDVQMSKMSEYYYAKWVMS